MLTITRGTRHGEATALANRLSPGKCAAPVKFTITALAQRSQQAKLDGRPCRPLMHASPVASTRQARAAAWNVGLKPGGATTPCPGWHACHIEHPGCPSCLPLLIVRTAGSHDATLRFGQQGLLNMLGKDCIPVSIKKETVLFSVRYHTPTVRHGFSSIFDISSVGGLCLSRKQRLVSIPSGSHCLKSSTLSIPKVS